MRYQRAHGDPEVDVFHTLLRYTFYMTTVPISLTIPTICIKYFVVVKCLAFLNCRAIKILQVVSSHSTDNLGGSMSAKVSISPSTF